MKKSNLKLIADPQPLKLDLGSGKGLATPDGFTKVDIRAAKDTEVVDLRTKWPWKTNSVDEAQANYLVHYLTRRERIHFANELYRVLKPGSRCVIHTPHWAASKAYGDLNAEMPPVTEGWYPFLNKAWREAQGCVIDGYTCNFDIGVGYAGQHPGLNGRNDDYKQIAMMFWREAVQELVCTVTALK